MKDLANAAPYATYDYALRSGREKLWKAVVHLQDTKTLLSISDATPPLGDAAQLAQDGGAFDAKKDPKAKGASDAAPAASGAEAASGKSTTQLEKLNEDLNKKKAQIAEIEKTLGDAVPPSRKRRPNSRGSTASWATRIATGTAGTDTGIIAGAAVQAKITRIAVGAVREEGGKKRISPPTQ